MLLVYINDLAAGIKCNVDLLADDTSLIFVVEDLKLSVATDMNHGLELIRGWAHD